MRIAVVCIALVACKGKETPPPPKPVVVADAAPAPEDWTARCAAALTAKQSPVRRIEHIIEGCQPCGDWTPLLDWRTAREADVEAAMVACKAFCTGDSKMQFMNELADSRDKQTDRAWRVLGDKCGDKVSALPDARFMSAPYFALDRIARAAAADAKLAPLLAAVELPLPPVSLTGVGFELPASAVMKPEPPRWHVTITLAEIRIGKLPLARLGANGVTVDGDLYPGTLVTDKELAAKLPAERILLIAPSKLPAARVTDVVKAMGAHEVVLAVAAAGAPKGWAMPGVVPITLDVAPDPKAVEWKLDAAVDTAIADLKGKPAAAFEHPRITIAKDATVAHLATLLGALAFRDAHAASLTNAKK